MQSFWFLPGLFTALYLIFPTSNSTGDAMGYAAATEIGPHHILYDQVCVWVNFLSGFSPVKTLGFMKVLNAVAAGFVLFFVRFLAIQLKPERANHVVLFSGSAFGFMRFATENETYILPLLFGVISLFYTYKYVAQGHFEYYVTALFTITLSVLFHQSYIFWYIAFVVSTFPFRYLTVRNILTLLLSVSMIGLTYVYYAGLNGQPLMQWVVEDANEGLVDLTPGKDNFIFTAIGLVRSLVQVHGNIIYILLRFPILWLCVGIAALAMGSGAILFFRSLKKNPIHVHRRWALVLMLAFGLQLLFAWFSVGNAEFMVMLPMLGMFLLLTYFNFSNNSVLFFAMGMLIWNLSMAIIPSSQIDFENKKALREFIEKNDQSVFILYNKTETENYLNLYRDSGQCIKSLTVKLFKAPGDFVDTAALGKLIRQNIISGKKIYTDCIDYPQPFNRHYMILKDANREFFSAYWGRMRTVDTLSNFYGKIFITEIY